MKKMMKRAGLFLLIATLLLSLTACGGAKDPLVGKWVATTAYDGKDFQNVNESWTIFNKDGTGSQSIKDSTYALTWELFEEKETSRSYTVTIDGLPLYLALSWDSESESFATALLYVDEDFCVFYEKQ